VIHFLKSLPLVAAALLVGCETIPEGPTVTALQGDARSSDEFRADDVACRQDASAAQGTAVAAGEDGRSSTVAGGGTGSLIDGADSAQYAGYGLQRRYNREYVRCMYTKGNKVPLLARERWPGPRSPWPPDPDAYYLPLQR
jgi:hypothetical protein